MAGILGRIGALLQPSTPESWSYEERIMSELLGGTAAVPEIIERVAEDAMRADQAQGAWVVDVGLWGRDRYRREALAAFQQMLGRSLVLQIDGDGHCLVAPVAA